MAKLLIGSLLLLTCGPVSAWGPVGHRAVGSIAEALLNPSALAEIHRILPADNISLADISNCADDIIYGPIRCANAFDIPSMPETRPWHFINIPARGKALPLRAYCPHAPGSPYGDCVVDRLRQQIRVLSDRTASLDDRRLALTFVVHLMGDLHQPLHAIDDDDQGGNRKPAEIYGIKTNLHSAWDGALSVGFVVETQLRFA